MSTIERQITELIAGDAQNEVQDEEIQEEQAAEEEQQEDGLLTDGEVQEAEGEVEAGEEGEEQGQISTISELAEAIELDPAQMYDLVVPMGDGVEPVTLSELKDKYQEYSRGGTAFEAEKTELVQQRDQLIQQVTMLKERPEDSPEFQQAVAEAQQIQSTYNSIDWTEFEKENPGEAALQRQKFSDAYTAATQKVQQAKADGDRKHQQFKQQQLQEQSAHLMKLIPEWTNADVREQERASVREFLSSYGFANQEIQNLSDARSVKMVYDFMKLKQKLATAEPERKKVVNKKKFMKPGKLKSVSKDRIKQRNAIIQAGKSTKNNQDKARAITHLLSMDN